MKTKPGDVFIYGGITVIAAIVIYDIAAKSPVGLADATAIISATIWAATGYIINTICRNDMR